MNQLTPEQLCREFTELTGGHWHESVASGKDITCMCDDCGKVRGNPTYENPADVLRVIEKLNNLAGFINYLNHGFSYSYIDYGYIIEPDALLKAAVEFLKERKKLKEAKE